MSPHGGTCTRACLDGLTFSCYLYTDPTNVPEGSVLSVLSFEADTEDISRVGFLTSLVPSQVPFFSGNEFCSLSHLAPVASHTWLLAVELNLAYVLYQ
jgi:hypothetical protein